MENNPTKKLSRTAAILSLTAVLASMPVSAGVAANATLSGASASAEGMRPAAEVYMCCEFGEDSKRDASSADYAEVSTSINPEDYRYGECRYTEAKAYINGELRAFDDSFN